KQRRKESYICGVVDEMAAEMKRLAPSYTSISTVPGFMDARPFVWDGFGANIYYTYFIDLRRPLDAIWEDMDKDCRREIRTTEKHALSLEQTHDVKAFFNIMKERYIQQGLNFPVMSEQYLEDILATFPDNIKMYLLYDADRVIDVMVNYEYNGRFMFWMGWVNLDKKIHSNEYATWEFLKMKKEEGYKEFEIAGGNTRRLCLFKSKFNPALQYFYTIEKMNGLGTLAEWAYLNLFKRKTIL
ncbi:MAG TPA: GNAT family N-acetyltransferase, partial [Methanocella sp.]|nr:GNAT family N-acetyltransferase [Methanocella sp.]